MHSLRSYQKICVETLWDSLVNNRRVLCVMATGLGKTESFIELIRRAKVRTVVLVGRDKLVEQTARRMRAVMDDVGVWSAGQGEKRIGLVTVVSIHSADRLNIEDLRFLVLDECFSGDVEVLTDKGFKCFDEIKNDSIVAQYKLDTREISFVKPTKIINKIYSGKMYKVFSERGIDLDCTENHEFIVNGQKKKIRDISFYNKQIPVCGLSSYKENSLSDLERIYIATQADGCIQYKSSVNFTFSKERKIKRLFEISKNFSLNETKKVESKNKKIKNKRRFKVKIDGIHKRVYEFFDLTKLSVKKCKEIIEEMVLWDGHIISKDRYYYSSVDKKCVDFFQSVAILAGYKTLIRIQKDHRKKTHKDVHRLYISKNLDHINGQRIKKTAYDYYGNVYCVRVPDGNLIVRRNGKVTVVGNCHNINEGRYSSFISRHPNAKIAGFTATPWRANVPIYGDGLTFPRIHYKRDVLAGIADGYLVRPITKSMPVAFDTGGLKERGGDFILKDLNKLTANRAKVQSQVEDAMSRLSDRKKIVWICTGIEHAELVAELIPENACLVHSKNPNNDYSMELFERGDVRHMVSVMMLTEGYDHPAIDSIVLMRPTKSATLYVQCIGRGLRPYEGKQDCLVLDYGQVVQNCGPLNDPYLKQPRGKSSGDKEKLDKTIRVCPKCLSYVIDVFECPDCGYEFKQERDALKALERKASSFDILNTAPRKLMCSKVEAQRYKSKAGNDCIKLRFSIDQGMPINMYGSEHPFSWGKVKRIIEKLTPFEFASWKECFDACESLVFDLPKCIDVEFKNGYDTITRVHYRKQNPAVSSPS